MGSMEGAVPLTASSPSLKRSSVTPRNALAMTSGFRGSRPLTISKTWRIFSALATELPPNFMTIIGGTLDRKRNHESRPTEGSTRPLQGRKDDGRRDLGVDRDLVEILDLGQHRPPALAGPAGNPDVAGGGWLLEEDPI